MFIFLVSFLNLSLDATKHGKQLTAVTTVQPVFKQHLQHRMGYFSLVLFVCLEFLGWNSHIRVLEMLPLTDSDMQFTTSVSIQICLNSMSKQSSLMLLPVFSKKTGFVFLRHLYVKETPGKREMEKT